jgi:hypothetical protein
MRTHRFLTALLGLALLGLIPVSLVAPATAAPATDVTSVPTAAAPAAARVKTERDLNDRSVKRGGSWFIVGRITPGGAKKAVVFKRKLGTEAPWRTWKRVQADNRGRFHVQVEFPTESDVTWYYKGVVYGSLKYADSRTEKIYTACRRNDC